MEGVGNEGRPDYFVQPLGAGDAGLRLARSLFHSRTMWRSDLSPEVADLVVVHTEQGDNIGIVSARRASRREIKRYEQSE